MHADFLYQSLGKERELVVYFNKKENRKLGHTFSVLHPDYEESIELMDKMAEFFKSRVS